MRLILACPACSRQYDVSSYSPGTRFHCSCGTVVEVGEPQAHDAAVVRCSSCGGPQKDGATSCNFCGSELTLHDRDLNTMCPGCLTRISDQARFCHSCGTVITAETVVSDETEHSCPVCGDEHRLTSRQLGEMGLSVLECGRCAGLWVGVETLRQLETKAKTESVEVDTGSAPKPVESSAAELAQGGSLYRPCVVCDKLMHRQNYGRRSGVIIDVCADHGVWFDDKELGQILHWVREGGHAHSQGRAQEEARQRIRQQSLAKATSTPVDDRRFEGRQGDFLSDLGTLLVRSFFG